MPLNITKVVLLTYQLLLANLCEERLCFVYDYFKPNWILWIIHYKIFLFLSPSIDSIEMEYHCEKLEPEMWWEVDIGFDDACDKGLWRTQVVRNCGGGAKRWTEMVSSTPTPRRRRCSEGRKRKSWVSAMCFFFSFLFSPSSNPVQSIILAP